LDKGSRKDDDLFDWSLLSPMAGLTFCAIFASEPLPNIAFESPLIRLEDCGASLEEIGGGLEMRVLDDE
jgi:hypothetical protein